MEYHVDAKGKVLGRLASDIAQKLQGKQHASFARNQVSGDKVYVENWQNVRVTGAKATQKIYYRHTGYVGHLKELTYKQQMEKNPKEILRRAVRKMLPRNFLTQKRIKNLVFVEAPKKAGAK